MEQRLIYDQYTLSLTIKRLCLRLIEDFEDFEDTVLLGLQPKGVFVAQRLSNVLLNDFSIKVQIGELDITFNRDDYRRRDLELVPHVTQIPFSLENKKVILVDDVLYTGRSVRAALDAMLAYGRPKRVELLVMINRAYSRELPIEPKYVGKTVNTLQTEKVKVEFREQGAQADVVWLTQKQNKEHY